MKALGAVFFLAALAAAGAAHAGGGSFGADDDDTDANAGPPFLGLVQDDSGKNLADVRITVTIASMNSTLVLRSDTVGHFFVRGFDKSVDPKDVKIVCSKDGYADATATTSPPVGNTPIQAICVLKKK
ncbi:MAG TPA: carboxypeptidase-like regulatory domain-containing protein [Stellaceae bacterium]|nr:carboxypeptidase-like regulatory domain-containing protein [Stellaceae bacterium]